MIRTRFAPSPTGFLHLGGARTALYAWLYARRHGGEFVLRLEDTDRERSTQAYVDAILEGMTWLGLDIDEGPVYQTQRMDRYQEAIQQLLSEGKAYRCTCSKERLDALRDEQKLRNEKPRYDGLCREANHSESTPHVIRFLQPKEGSVVFDDQVRGRIEIDNSELDDLIIARTDGTPTYNFTVVIDDADMKITQVIRGDDHINNTPRQINIFKALGLEPPEYAHLPMILGEDGKRLSKRHGADNVLSYRDQGIWAPALLNYLVRLGWSHGDQEIFSKEEMISLFDFEHIQHSPASFSLDKLLWVNQDYLKTTPPHDLGPELLWHFQKLGVDTSNGPALQQIIEMQAERSKTLVEMATKSRFFFEDMPYEEKAAKKFLVPDNARVFKAIHAALESVALWNAEAIHEAVIKTAESLDLKLGKVAQPIRVAVSGGTVSPSIDVTLQALGQEKTLQRLARALEKTTE